MTKFRESPIGPAQLVATEAVWSI